jgi:enoyl-CoA hydratase/carnithine racemase
MRTLLLSGEAIGASRAAAAGLVAETAPAIDVLPVSMTRARQLADKPAQAFAAHKAALDMVGGELSRSELDAEVAHVMEHWFGDEAKARRAALIEKLAKKG